MFYSWNFSLNVLLTPVSWHAEQLVTTDSLVALAMMLGEDRAEAHCKAVAGYEQDMRRWLDDKNEASRPEPVLAKARAV
eukprot:COSAG06_NODE_167_length_21546_cov_35.001352_19_plen_79_part_00